MGSPKGQQRGKNLKREVSYTDTTGERLSVSKEVSIGSSDGNLQGFQPTSPDRASLRAKVLEAEQAWLAILPTQDTLSLVLAAWLHSVPHISSGSF